jgi:ATP-dependent exoDNAse (exonuclease V) beta subunit
MTKTFITAGAGSGKTYRITTDVAKMVNEKVLHPNDNVGIFPDQVIMTTFTKAAAQELREKAKIELVKLGLHKEAQQMEHALIGTVHSIANTFLTKYWYLLGITPDAAAMDEDEVSVYRDHSLKGLLEPEERKFMYEYCERYDPQNKDTHKTDYEFWKKDLCQVLDYIKWYEISDKQLDQSLKTTQTIIDCLAPSPIISLKDVFTQKFYNEVNAFFGIKQGNLTDKQQAAKDFYDSLRKINEVTPEIVAKFLEHKELKITSKKVDYKLEGPATQKVSNYLVGTNHFTTENSKNHRSYAEIVFSLAKRWKKTYRHYKDEHHLIDFNDMEELFLKLLGMPEVQNDIKSRFRWLFVDEFQDSNPMQVRIFEKLSTLLDTVYVGDKKQAIYGFRGSDTELTTAVAGSIEDLQHLKHSYRSIEPLVNFSNVIFSQIFNHLPKKEVTLTMPEEHGNYDAVEKPLRIWPRTNDKELALQIQQFILHEEGNIESNEIAVLARTNANLDKLADELRKLHVPVCREESDIKDSRTGRLLKALLTLVNSPSNQLARAEIAYLTCPGFHISKIIEHRLDHLTNQEATATSYLEEIPILKRFAQLRWFRSEEQAEFSMNLLGYQSISALVESLIIELDLYALVQSWENAQTEEANLQAFIELARKYEDTSTKLAQPATVTGFIDFFNNQKQKGALNEDGVRLFTYHKSKGLEWKVVIMLSLEDDAAKETDIAMLSMLGCHWHREKAPKPDDINSPMTISLVRNIYGKSNEARSAITARLQEHPLWGTVRDHEIDEAARLLYVGVTRARNILILAPVCKNGMLNLNWFRSVGINDINLQYNNQTKMDLFNNTILFDVETVDRGKQLPWPEQKLNKVHDIAKDPAPLNDILFVAPSKAGRSLHEIRIINDKENRMEIHYNTKNDEDALMGDFIHQVFCCCDDGISVKQIEQLRDSYGFTEKNLKEPKRLLDSWKYLIDTLESHYGKAIKRHHERPFRHLDENGHIVSGYIDFIWETEDAYVVVDYKTCPGDYSLVFTPSSEHYVGCHGDQLDCYQRALEAEGKKKVKARVIYYPVTQFVVEVL